MLRKAPIALALVMAMLGPAAPLCADCMDCPPGVEMAPALCHEEPVPVVVADCCARVAAADESAPAPATAPAAVPAVAVADGARPAVFAAVTLILPLSISPARGGVHLFTLHSALLI